MKAYFQFPRSHNLPCSCTAPLCENFLTSISPANMSSSTFKRSRFLNISTVAEDANVGHKTWEQQGIHIPHCGWEPQQLGVQLDGIALWKGFCLLQGRAQIVFPGFAAPRTIKATYSALCLRRFTRAPPWLAIRRAGRAGKNLTRVCDASGQQPRVGFREGRLDPLNQSCTE